MLVSPLVLVSNTLSNPPDVHLEPRRDYLELAQALGAKLQGYHSADDGWHRLIRRLETRLRLDLVEASAAYRQLNRHNAVLSLSEKVALPLALMRRDLPVPHVLIAHKLSSGLKTRLIKKLHLQKSFAGVICVSRSQAAYAVEHLGLEPNQVHFVFDKVDHHFYHPQPVDPGDFILAVGQEQRDYLTLLRALSGTGIKLVVVASSPWSTSHVNLSEIDANVEVRRHIPYTELRDLYATARLVVVPLHLVDYAAGANSLLEAMSMSKAVILSQTPGLSGYVNNGETGVLVSPNDVIELRDTILTLWDQPQTRMRLGANARQVVEQTMNMDQYVSQITEIVMTVIERDIH